MAEAVSPFWRAPVGQQQVQDSMAVIDPNISQLGYWILNSRQKSLLHREPEINSEVLLAVRAIEHS